METLETQIEFYWGTRGCWDLGVVVFSVWGGFFFSEEDVISSRALHKLRIASTTIMHSFH